MCGHPDLQVQKNFRMTISKEQVKTVLCWTLGACFLLCLGFIEINNKHKVELMLSQQTDTLQNKRQITEYFRETEVLRQEAIEEVRRLKRHLTGLELKQQGNLLRFKDIDYQLKAIAQEISRLD